MMTALEEYERLWERQRDLARREVAMNAVVETLHERWYRLVYLPMMNRLIADARVNGILPKDPL